MILSTLFCLTCTHSVIGMLAPAKKWRLNRLTQSKNRYVALSSNQPCHQTSRQRRCRGRLAHRPLQTEAFRQLADTKFYAKVNKDLTQASQKIVKDTVNKLILEQKLPSTARNLFVTTPKTSTFYLKPKIHKPNNPGRPIISACSCPTELISSFLDKKMAPFRPVYTTPDFWCGTDTNGTGAKK